GRVTRTGRTGRTGIRTRRTGRRARRARGGRGRCVTRDDVRIQLDSGQLGEVDLGLLRHLRERLVVEDAVDLVDGRTALGREVLPRTGERIEIGGHGQCSVDDGG